MGDPIKKQEFEKYEKNNKLREKSKIKEQQQINIKYTHITNIKHIYIYI